ncbi:MAG: phosphatidylcholine/phosphatidylserine synthase [Treponema sp.]|nr:phosphatidylcholine/phosphatidylserine synthase [Treponema sp.]
MKIRPFKIRQLKIRKAKKKSERPDNPQRRKRRLKYIAVLPSFITLLNGALGFIAIVFASRSAEHQWVLFFTRNNDMTAFALAAYVIILAMIADMLDGRVARLTRTTSSFGGQLDSLSDAVSFGVAPAFLMIMMLEYNLAHISFGQEHFSSLIERGIFFSCIIYAMCALLRLARFNVENEEDGTTHMQFVGLPSPSAAGLVVSLVIFHQHFLHTIDNNLLEMIVVIAFPAITFLTGILMVSRIRYPHLANQLLRGKKSLPGLLFIFATLLFIVWNIQLALLVVFCGYALFGVLRWLFLISFGRAKSKKAPQPEPLLTDDDRR